MPVQQLPPEIKERLACMLHSFEGTLSTSGLKVLAFCIGFRAKDRQRGPPGHRKASDH